eukprot:1485769-Pyramimonas_sp.AAC.2
MVSTYEPKEYSPTHLYEAQSSRSTVGRLRAIKVVKATKVAGPKGIECRNSPELLGWLRMLPAR